MGSPSATRGHFIDLRPLTESPAFARLWAGSAIAGIGNQMTIVAVGLHIYHLTHSTFAVAMVGTVALAPMIVAGIYGGMLADAFDRRIVALAAAGVAWMSTAGLAAYAWSAAAALWPFYALTALISVASTIIGTSRSAILPRLVPPHLIAAASALGGISSGLMITVGPALAGVLVAGIGFGWTYTIDVVLFSAAFAGIATLPPIRPEGATDRPGWASIRAGAAFLRNAPNIRMSFIVDIIAMTFGRPHALFPAVAMLILGGGPVTVGILTAASAIGTLLSSLASGKVGQVRFHGRAIGWSIAAYGAFVCGFGVVVALTAASGARVSENEPATVAIAWAALMMAGTGAADNVSSIFRSTMLQMAVPDAMRGRLHGIFYVVVTGGPRLGDLYVGGMSLVAALWAPPLIGGLAIIALVALCLRGSHSFRAYDALNPTP